MMKKFLITTMIAALILSTTAVAFAEEPVLISAPIATVSYLGDEVLSDVSAQKVDGIMMVPLRSTLEKIGYSVKWDPAEKVVEVSKGAQYTKVDVGKNYYIKNKMAPIELSHSPVIVDGRAMVPLEFYSVILSIGTVVENGNIEFSDEEPAIHSGYIAEIVESENGMMSITISSVKGSQDPLDWTVLHTSASTTYYNTSVEEGVFVNGVCSPIMTMSLPGQTSAYVIY